MFQFWIPQILRSLCRYLLPQRLLLKGVLASKHTYPITGVCAQTQVRLYQAPSPLLVQALHSNTNAFLCFDVQFSVFKVAMHVSFPSTPCIMELESSYTANGHPFVYL